MTFVARYSFMKVLKGQAILIVLGLVPFLPGVEDRLTTTRFLFEPPFIYFIYVCAVVMIGLAIVMCRFAYLSISKIPAIRCDGVTLTVTTMKTYRLRLSEIATVTARSHHAFDVTDHNGTRVHVPLFFVQDRDRAAAFLKSLVSA